MADPKWSIEFCTPVRQTDRERYPGGWWYVYCCLSEDPPIEGEGEAATLENSLAMCLEELVERAKKYRGGVSEE